MTSGVYWFEQTPADPCPPADGDLHADVVVVGGGIAGLTAARCLRDAGRDVVLLERDVCGSGATGRSSGFITPDSELELAQLLRRFGEKDAALLWRAAQEACERIREEAGPSCDLVVADSLYVASSKRGVGAIRAEHEAHCRLGLESRLYEGEALRSLLGSDRFFAGMRAGGTFGINGFAWAQGLKRTLVAGGLRVFEGSEVVRLAADAVWTARAVVRAPKIVICLDRFAPQVGIATRDEYHATASLTLTEPLSAATRASLFPDGPLIVWDTDLVYKYFRPTGEGRLLVGGGLLRDTYRAREAPDTRAFAMLHEYAITRFPQLEGTRFTHQWQGLIGMSRDLLPIAGRSPACPSHYYALAAAGLPWSVLAAETGAAQLLGERTPLDRFFSPSRRFTPFDSLQDWTGKGVAWALSYYYSRNVRGRSA